jgi:hypothetical protein
MHLLDVIQGERILQFESGLVAFIGDMDIDCDGSGGNPDHDPYFQPDTTLHFKGKALNAYQVPFIVIPPVIAKRTREMVLGARACVTDLRTGRSTVAVVGDIGPSRKIGEASVECARRLGLPSNPNHGGVDIFTIGYEITPGVGAEIDGVLYDLQPYGKRMNADKPRQWRNLRCRPCDRRCRHALS